VVVCRKGALERRVAVAIRGSAGEELSYLCLPSRDNCDRNAVARRLAALRSYLCLHGSDRYDRKPGGAVDYG
jgi:hypothetical protein